MKSKLKKGIAILMAVVSFFLGIIIFERIMAIFLIPLLVPKSVSLIILGWAVFLVGDAIISGFIYAKIFSLIQKVKSRKSQGHSKELNSEA